MRSRFRKFQAPAIRHVRSNFGSRKVPSPMCHRSFWIFSYAATHNMLHVAWHQWFHACFRRLICDMRFISIYTVRLICEGRFSGRCANACGHQNQIQQPVATRAQRGELPYRCMCSTRALLHFLAAGTCRHVRCGFTRLAKIMVAAIRTRACWGGGFKFYPNCFRPTPTCIQIDED